MVDPVVELAQVIDTADAKAVYRDLAERTDTLAPTMRRSLSVLFGDDYRHPSPKALIKASKFRYCNHRRTVQDMVRYGPCAGEACRRYAPHYPYVCDESRRVARLLSDLSSDKGLLPTQRDDYRNLADSWDAVVASSILLMTHIVQLNRLERAARKTGRAVQATRIGERASDLISSVCTLHTDTASALRSHAEKAKAELEYQRLASELDMGAANPIVDALHQQVNDAIDSIAGLSALTGGGV